MIASLTCAMVRLLCGANANWVGCAPSRAKRVYFANHSSHLDFVVLWSALPGPLRRSTRPVAARDYWERGRMRPYFAVHVFNALLVERRKITRGNNPLTRMVEAVEAGSSLILFPEGTRSSDGEIHAFKEGLWHLSRKLEDVEFIPVYLDNLTRVLPRGEFLPVPMLGSATFGAPIEIIADEPKDAFLERARSAVLAVRGD